MKKECNSCNGNGWVRSSLVISHDCARCNGKGYKELVEVRCHCQCHQNEGGGKVRHFSPCCNNGYITIEF